MTYDGFAAAWPSRTGEFADKMNRSPKYVVSSTLDDPPWENTTVIKGDVAEEVSSLKQQPGGTILVHGSPQLVRTLLAHGLVESRAVGPDGIVILVYRPAGDSAASEAAA